MITLSEIEEKQVRGRISPRDILLGKNIPAIDRLKIMSPDDFEDFIYEWIKGYLKDKYNKGVKRLGGAGDKGRDVVGYKDDDSIDIYQCKHYSSQLSPSVFMVELGKLIYYTYCKHLIYPKNYYIITTCGVGPKLYDLINNPAKMKEKLISTWSKYCQDGITKKKVIPLDVELEKYINECDFSVISSIEPLDIIEQHSKTSYHATRFGGGLQKTRNGSIKADIEVQPREFRYIECLREIYEEDIASSIKDCNELENLEPDLFQHYQNQRDGFYSAESLERFSRDNFPLSNPLPFDELKRESKSIIVNSLISRRGDKGLIRLTESVNSLETQPFSSNALKDEITVLDKCGICHHLVNTEEIYSWYSTSKPK